MKDILDIYMKIKGDYVAVKITKHEATENSNEYYERALEKVYKEKGNADFKATGETFKGSDLEEVFFRINSYVRELNRVDIEAVKCNPYF